MLSKEITSAAFLTLLAHVSYGSLPASTNFDKVDVYADMSAYRNASNTRITFYLYGTSGAVKTLLKTLGPYGAGSAPAKLITLDSEPGVTYSLEAAVTSGAILPGVAIKAGLVGYDLATNVSYDVDATPSPTALVYGTEVVIADVLSTHSRWNTRVDVQGARYPDVTYRFYNVITAGGLTLTALITEQRVTSPAAGGFQVFDAADFGGDHIQVTAMANDTRAVGADAISLQHATIGSDPTNDNGLTPSAANLAQTAWHINPTTGNNEWDGTAAVHVAGTLVGPIASAAEYLRRTGLNRPIANPVDIYIEADLLVTDPLVITGTILATAGYIHVQGVPTVTAAGTLTGYTAPVPATNTLPDITDALVADWTPYAGMLLRFTSGAHANKSALWIVKNLGANKARVSQPSYHNTYYDLTAFAPAGNETYEIVSPRILGGGLVLNVIGAAGGNPTIARLSFCTVPSAFTSMQGGCFNDTYVYACSFPLLYVSATPGEGTGFLALNCQFGASLYVFGTLSIYGGYFNGTAVAVDGGNLVLDWVALAVRAGTMRIGASAHNPGGVSTFTTSAGIQIADTTNYFQTTGPNSSIWIGSDIYGVIDAAIMYTIGSGTKAITTAIANLRIGGATFDIKIAGKTSIFPIVTATGLPAAAVAVCSILNFGDPAQFASNIHDPLTGTAFLLAA